MTECKYHSKSALYLYGNAMSIYGYGEKKKCKQTKSTRDGGSKYRDIQSGIGVDFFKGNNISVFIILNIDK